MYYYNSLPYRQYIIMCSPECGNIGYGWPIDDYFGRRRHKRCKRRHRYSHYPYSREWCFPFFPYADDQSYCSSYGYYDNY